MSNGNYVTIYRSMIPDKFISDINFVIGMLFFTNSNLNYVFINFYE